jgi:Leu/Phe-tRNA-protein transferase
MSIADNRAWSAVSVVMIYFILAIDFHSTALMSNQMNTNHLAQLRVLEFARPKLPAHLLQ